MAGAASSVPVSAPAGAVAGARTLLRRSLHGNPASHARCCRDRAGTRIINAPHRLRRRGAAQSAGHGDRATGFSRPPRGAALRSRPARRCELEAGAAEILRAQGLSPGAGAVEGSGQPGRAHRLGGAGDTGPRAYGSRGAACPVRALASPAHQPGVCGSGPAGTLGDAARAPPRGARDRQHYLPGNRALAAGLHVSAIGVRGHKRRGRDFSFPRGLALAGAGSSTRLVGHTPDPYPLHGRADLLLPGKRLTGVRRADDRVCPCGDGGFAAVLAGAEAKAKKGPGNDPPRRSGRSPFRIRSHLPPAPIRTKTRTAAGAQACGRPARSQCRMEATSQAGLTAPAGVETSG